MRIAKALALAGIASRRKCEEFITRGEIKVNGQQVLDLGRQVDPESDMITFRGKLLGFDKYVYYVLNKPEGYITSAGDPHAEKTVYDILPRQLAPRAKPSDTTRRRVFPVGRLDKDTMGILLFTNDGDLANRLIHPRYGVGKWYEVRLNKAFDPAHKGVLLHGVRLKEGWAKVEKIRGISRRTVQVMIREGKKREVRRLFERLNYQVVRLIRFAFGPIVLGSLPLGSGRFLNKSEIATLKEAVYSEAPEDEKRPSVRAK